MPHHLPLPSNLVGMRGKEIWGGMRSWGVEFSEFYATAKDDCLRIVLISVGDRQLAEDLVAEAFTRAWMSWRKVRDHPAPRAWVVRTALNTHVSWWRRRRREVPLVESESSATWQPAGIDDALVSAIRALPMRQREVIVLRVFFDLDTEATAALLGISPGTVGVHLHRALGTLRTHVPSFLD
jgi:RNA polymerase sigma-70 factor (sigma-E family)